MDDPVGTSDLSAGFLTPDLLVQDTILRARASKVIPGGMWGHMNARALPQGYPQFFSAAKGARIWDVDGNEYIDFMCGFGPMILGYADPDVEAAFEKQRSKMDIANGPAEVMVELGRERCADLGC